MFHAPLKSTKISIFPYLSPNFLKTEFILCINFIRWTLFLEIIQKGNFHIYSILWKCPQGRCPNRIDNSPNKSHGTPGLSMYGQIAVQQLRLKCCSLIGKIQHFCVNNCIFSSIPRNKKVWLHLGRKFVNLYFIRFLSPWTNIKGNYRGHKTI